MQAAPGLGARWQNPEEGAVAGPPAPRGTCAPHHLHPIHGSADTQHWGRWLIPQDTPPLSLPAESMPQRWLNSPSFSAKHPLPLTLPYPILAPRGPHVQEPQDQSSPVNQLQRCSLEWPL